MDLIDREELLKTLRNFDYVKWYYRDLTDAIINMPTVDAEPVRHGKWIAQDTSRTKFMCSECKAKNYGGHEKYCPNCGAKMED